MAHYDIIAPMEATDALPVVRVVTVADLKDALSKGIEDFWALPSQVIFLCWIIRISEFCSLVLRLASSSFRSFIRS